MGDVDFTPPLIVGALILAGLPIATWVFLPVFRGPDAARRHLGTHRLAIGSLAIVVLLAGVLSIPLIPVMLNDSLSAPTFVAAAIATYVPMILLLYARLVAPGALDWSDLGLRPISWRRTVAAGVLASIAGLVIIEIFGLVLQFLEIQHNQTEQFAFIQRESIGGFLLVLAVGAVAAPIIEELFFRGFLFGLYQRRYGAWVAYLASGLLFAVLHVNPSAMDLAQSIGLVLSLIGLSAVLAYTYARTQSLYPGMLAHGINNALVLSLLYLSPGVVA